MLESWGPVESPDGDNDSSCSLEAWGPVDSPNGDTDSSSSSSNNHILRPSELLPWLESGKRNLDRVGTALCTSVQHNHTPDPCTLKIVNHFLGALPPPAGTKTMEAIVLGMSRWKLTDEFLTLSAATCCATRLWIGGFLRQVVRLITSGKYIAKACGSFFMCDETVLPSGKHTWQAKPKEHKQAKEAGPLKMVQSELMLGLFLIEKASGKPCFWTVPVVTPLQCTDHCTGETLHTMWQLVMDIPHWQEVCGLFPHVFQCRTLDRAAPNWRAHRMMQETHSEFWHLWLSCDSHLVSTVTGRSYSAVEALITGNRLNHTPLGLWGLRPCNLCFQRIWVNSCLMSCPHPLNLAPQNGFLLGYFGVCSSLHVLSNQDSS